MKIAVVTFLMLTSSIMKAQKHDTGKAILTIGASTKILQNLSDELRRCGYRTETFNEYHNLDLMEETFKYRYFDVVAFGRALSDPDLERLTSFFRQSNPKVKIVKGMAPIIPLLLAQIEEAANNNSMVSTKITMVSSNEMEVDAPASNDIAVTFYHLNWLYKKSITVIYSGTHDGEKLRLILPKKTGSRFISINVDGKITLVKSLF